MKRVLFVISILVLASLACQLSGLPNLQLEQPTPRPTIPVSAPVLPNVPDPATSDNTLVALYAQVLPGVVSISTGQSIGSGFVFDSNGHIVTNQHVVADANGEVEVAFSSGYKAYGTVIGSDADADVAVIQVNVPAEQLHPLAVGDSSQLQVGQTVIAIGNPFGLNGTMTVGIVSGLGRSQFAHASPEGGFFSTADIIQTDAAINPGNSGGPLFNMNGEVVGVNQSIRTENIDQTTGNPLNSGVGFSISINLVKRVADALINDGRYAYPFLGITSRDDLPLTVIEALGLNTYTGAYVVSVTPGGPADQAGIRGGSVPTSISGLEAGGDVITAIDGRPIVNFDQLLSYLLSNKSPGDAVVLTILREGQPQDVTITLGERP